MTIATTVPRVAFLCDGITTVFPVPIQAYAAADFLVLLTASAAAGGATTILTLGSNYGLAASSTDSPPKWTLTSSAGGGVASPYPAGYTLQVILNPAQTHASQYVQGQAFPSLTVQTDLDRLTQMVQRLQDELSRTIHAPDGDVSPGMLLPPANQRASLYLATDPNGNIILTAALPGTANTAASLGPILNPQTAAETAAFAALGFGSVVNFLLPVGYVDRYKTNAVPGTTDMTQPINVAVQVAKQQGGGEVVFQPGADYFVVPTPTGPTGVTAISLVSMNNVYVRGRGARIISNTPVISIPVIWLLQDCNQITIEGLRGYDTGANITVDFQGPWFIYATTATANDCGGINVRDVQVQNLLGPIAVTLTTGTGRVRGVHFTNLKADACYYGTPSLQENGDGVTGSVIVNNCRRAGFPYGVSGGDLTYDIWHDAVSAGANATLDFKRYKRDTSGLKIRASFHGSPVQFGSIVNFEIQATLGTLGLTALGAITAGNGLYTNGWYANVPVTGSISGASNATLTLEFSGGNLVNAWIDNPGNGYLATDILTFTAANVGGTGAGASVAASAVGGRIYDCDIDLDLSGCTFPDPSVTLTTPFPVQFRSLTPGGALQANTPDMWDGITIRGNLGDWSFAQPGQTPQPINVLSTQTGAPGRLHLGGDFYNAFGGDPQNYPGFVVRTNGNTDVYTKLGDLTAAPMLIDLSRYDGHGFALKVIVRAVFNSHLGDKGILNEYLIGGSKPPGGAITNLSANLGANNVTTGAAPDVPVFAASGLNALSVTHTNYNNALSYCRMEVQHLERFAGSQ